MFKKVEAIIRPEKLDIVKNNKNIKNLILNEDSQLTFKICENITKTKRTFAGNEKVCTRIIMQFAF